VKRHSNQYIFNNNNNNNNKKANNVRYLIRCAAAQHIEKV